MLVSVVLKVEGQLGREDNINSENFTPSRFPKQQAPCGRLLVLRLLLVVVVPRDIALEFAKYP